MRGPRNRFDPPRSRRWWAIGMAVIAMACGIAWWLYPRVATGPDRREARQAIVTPAAAGSVTASNGAASVAPSASVALVSAVRSPGPDELEVCGRGLVKLAPQTRVDEPAMDEMLRKLLDASTWLQSLFDTSVRDRWSAAMLANGHPKVRAAGLLMAAEDFSDGASIERLAHLAHESRDAQVYAWALAACSARSDRTPGAACQRLTYEQWAALQPNHAAPWFHLAGEARQRGADPSEALNRAVHAEVLGASFGSLPAAVLSAQPADATPLDRYTIATQAIALSAALVARTPYPTQFCDRALLQDANRRQQCEAIAQLLLTRAETLLDLMVARGLGERLGWPADRLDAIRDESRVLQQAQSARSDPTDLSCAGVERFIEYTSDVARLGELGAMREAVRRSGATVEDLVAQRRRERTAASAPGR